MITSYTLIDQVKSRKDFEDLQATQYIVALGESFTSCSRVRQEETWPHYLNDKSEKIKVLNFGVDGYSMAQCLLWYKRIKNKVPADIVLLTFCPSIDLWRDINICRQLRFWKGQNLLPRFILRENKLKLIKSLYKTRDEYYSENKQKLAPKIKRHLRKYDRFYFKSKYEEPALIGKFIFYKLFARFIYNNKLKNIKESIMNVNPEAVIITKKIFETMNEEIVQENGNFVLVFLPRINDIRKYENNNKYKDKWDSLILFMASDGYVTIDLMEYFSKYDLQQLDTGYDRTHYGPKVNKFIADCLQKELKKLELF